MCSPRALVRFYRQSWPIIAAFVVASLGISMTTVLLWQKSQAKTILPQTESVGHHPTAIPWLTSRSACEATGRHWHEDTCWDGEHDPKF